MGVSRAFSTLGPVLALLALVACSSPVATESGSQAQPAATGGERSTSVSNPLDAKQVDPCVILDDRRVERLGGSPASAENVSSGAAGRCAWTANDDSFLLDIVIDVNAGIGLAYALRPSFPAFEEISVSGYPAVRVDPPEAAQCRIWVGIAESQVFTATARNLSTSAPPLCEKAEALAVEVIDALRSRS